MNRRHFTAAVAGLLATAGAAESVSLRRYAIRPPRKADRPVLFLEAVVATRLPGVLALVETPEGGLAGPAVETRLLPPLLELRTYPSAVPLSGVLSTLGIEPWLVPGCGRPRPLPEPRASASGQTLYSESPEQYLIPFESLSHRDRFWREVTAHQAWPAYRFAIYRPLPALRTT